VIGSPKPTTRDCKAAGDSAAVNRQRWLEPLLLSRLQRARARLLFLPRLVRLRRGAERMRRHQSEPETSASDPNADDVDGTRLKFARWVTDDGYSLPTGNLYICSCVAVFTPAAPSSTPLRRGSSPSPSPASASRSPTRRTARLLRRWARSGRRPRARTRRTAVALGQLRLTKPSDLRRDDDDGHACIVPAFSVSCVPLTQ